MGDTNGLTKQDLIEMETRLGERLEKRLDERLDTRMKLYFTEFETHLKLHVSEELEKVETKLLAEFWKWGRTNDQKIRRVEYSDATTVERLANLEERVFTLERKVAGSKD